MQVRESVVTADFFVPWNAPVVQGTLKVLETIHRPDEIELIVQDTGLPLNQIRWNANAENIWRSVFELAIGNRAVSALLDAVAKSSSESLVSEWREPLLELIGTLVPEVQGYGEWRLIAPECGIVRAIQADPLEPGTVFAGLNGQGVYRSGDGGRTWRPLNAGLGNLTITSVAVSAFDQRLLAATEAGLWQSDDRGVTWAEHPKFRGRELLCVALSPLDPEVLLVGVRRPGGTSAGAGTVAAASGSAPPTHSGTEGSGLKISRDRGKTWVSLQDVENANGFWADPADSRVCAAASAERGVFFSRDHEEMLRPVTGFPSDQQPLCVALLPGDPDRLLVGTLRGGVFWSDDDGAQWQRAVGIPDGQVSDITPLPETPSTVMAATTAGVFESDDGGATWRRASDGLAYDFCAALAPLSDGTVLVGTSGGGVYRRARRQRIWNPWSIGFPPAGGYRVAEAGGWLILGTNAGVYRSPDGETRWRFAGLAGKAVTALTVEYDTRSTGPSGSAVILRHDQPVDVLAGTKRGELFVSHDSGATWEPLPPPPNMYPGMIRSITLSPGPPRRIGVLVHGRGFFLSEDDGPLAELPAALGRNINLVVASVHDDRKLFGLTVDRGVHISRDAGITWSKCAGFPDEEVILAVAEPPGDTDVVFAASLLRTVYRSNDGGCTFMRIGGVAIPEGSERKLRWTTLVAHARPNGPTTLVLGSSLGAYLSMDEAATWTPLPAGKLGNEYHVNDLYFTYSGDTLLMATVGGLFTRSMP
jgi:photosystem II stability/assembly factor-like uncharacterized protein